MRSCTYFSAAGALTLIAAGFVSSSGSTIAASGRHSAAASRTIRIGWAGPLTGDQAYFGSSWLKGVQLAAMKFKFTGKLAHSTVKVIPLDDAADPAQGVTVAHRFVAMHVDGVIADFNSGVTLAAEPIYHRANIPQVTNSSNPAITARHYKNLIRLIANDNVQGGVMAKFAKQGLHLKTVAVFNDSQAFGQGVATTFAATARRYGITLIGGNTALSPTSQDYTSALNPVLARKPQGIYFGGVAVEAGLLCRQARQAGFTGPFMGPDGTYDPALIKGCGPRIGRFYVSFQAPPYNSNARIRAFAAQYRKVFHTAPQAYSVYGYSEMAYLLTAINKAGTTYHPAVDRALHHIVYRGFLGKMTVYANGDLKNAPIYVYKVAGNTFKLVTKG